MFHHVGVFVADFEASRRFYVSALAAVGLSPQYETDRVCEFWRSDADTPSLSLERGEVEVTRGVHLAFEAADRAAVDAFFRAAVSAGGRERHAPRFWQEYSAYCAFVSDPEGNNIEACHKEVER